MLGQYRASSKERKVFDGLVAITAVCMRGEGEGGERGGVKCCCRIDVYVHDKQQLMSYGHIGMVS